MKICKIIFGLSLLLSIAAPVLSQSLNEAMTDHLECYPLELLNLQGEALSIVRRDLCLASIYHETGAQPLWVTEEGPGEKAIVIRRYLNNSFEEGLEPDNYQVNEIDELWYSTSFLSLARLDTLLTYNLVKYVHDISSGQLGPYFADPKLFAEAGDSDFSPLATIEEIQETDNLEEFFQSLPPQHLHYQKLKKALSICRQVDKFGEWRKIAQGKTLRLGDEDERVVDIRARLSLLSDSSEEREENWIYDKELEVDVRKFQSLHGLKEDGIIGKETLRDLNVAPAARIDQIRVNMARWRWHARELGEKYVLVNIANYQLYGYREDVMELSLPVIVGKLQHQTPVFSDFIKYIALNPYWNVPPSIAMNEQLPKLKENPGYLLERNIRLFSNWQDDGIELDSEEIDWSQVTRSQMAQFKLRQEPGDTNALGRMKFVFPNSYAIYLHDTPSRDLFSQTYRSFSHGCIRVSNPLELANFILEEEKGWNRKKITEALDLMVRKIVRVNPGLAVHITYQTAWVDKEDQIHFNRDIYGRDKKLQKAMKAK